MVEAEKIQIPQLKWAVIQFPGTWSDHDTDFALNNHVGQKSHIFMHRELPPLDDFDAISIPGGFSYGDYLRTGAIAAKSPAMIEVKKQVGKGKAVLGVCNGFQIACESGLLPGVLLKNNVGQFRCQDTFLRVERTDTMFTNQYKLGEVVRIPISHGEGNYWAPEEDVKELENNGRVLFRYCDENGLVIPEANPNGSLHNIAGILNKEENVLGMMPHPERVCEELVGGVDGKRIFTSIAYALSNAR